MSNGAPFYLTVPPSRRVDQVECKIWQAGLALPEEFYAAYWVYVSSERIGIGGRSPRHHALF